MCTVAQSPISDNLLALAITEATRRAVAAYPHAAEGEQARLLRGAMLALDSKVTLLEGEYAEVASQFGTYTYAVNGTCPCPDSRHNGGLTVQTPVGESHLQESPAHPG